jgi:hypothetical protein
MVKSSHKPDHKGNPIDDMNAGYMASNVKAPVMNKGGAVKLVDRLVFSQANFNVAKDWVRG